MCKRIQAWNSASVAHIDINQRKPVASVTFHAMIRSQTVVVNVHVPSWTHLDPHIRF